MPRELIFSTIVAVICVTGCAPHVPPGTAANSHLQHDIARMIKMHQQAYDPECSWKIVSTDNLGVRGGVFEEEWLVEACGRIVSYDVELKPLHDGGGTTFGVRRNGP